MGSGGKTKQPDNKALAAQYQQQQVQEQQRLDQQRMQYETERQNLLSQLAAQQQQQQSAQTEQQKLLATQNAQQLSNQTSLIEQLKQQYGAQTEALGQQLNTYKDLGAAQDKQAQYLGYLQTQAGAQAQQEATNVRDQLAIDQRNQGNRQGVMSKMAAKRVKTTAPEYVRSGTISGSASKLLR